MNKKSRMFILVSIGVLICFIAISIFLLNRAGISFVQASEPTIERVDPFKEEIEFYQSMLETPDLSDIAATSYQRKLNIVGYAATQRSTALTATPPRTMPIPLNTTGVLGFKLPDGIDNTPEGPFSRAVFNLLNLWRKHTEGHYYLVYAGYLTDDNMQGAVYVFQPNNATYHLYITPDRRGAVRVVAENGTTITLQSTDNTFFYFNATTEQFVNAQGTPFPATPTPINNSPATPIPYP